MSKKDIAISFVENATTGNLNEAYRHVVRNFRHHNPYLPAYKDAIRTAAHKIFPNTTIDVQRAIAEDDLVAVHSRVSHGLDQRDIAVVHIFRFEGNQIVVVGYRNASATRVAEREWNVLMSAIW